MGSGVCVYQYLFNVLTFPGEKPWHLDIYYFEFCGVSIGAYQCVREEKDNGRWCGLSCSRFFQSILQRDKDFPRQATEAELQWSLVGESNKRLISIFTANLSTLCRHPGGLHEGKESSIFMSPMNRIHEAEDCKTEW